MFFYLLPGGIFIGALLGWIMIERMFSEDSRNFGGAMCVLVMAPLALIYGIKAIFEACRPDGPRALLRALAWNAPVALGPCAILWIVVSLGLFKHL